MGERFSKELEWLVPGALLTLASVTFVLVEIPDYSGIVPALLLLPMWMVAAGGVTAVIVFFATLAMMRRGIDHPIRFWMSFVTENRRKILFVVACMALAGLNMITFMWIKPLLNYLIPFWADPYLASIDRDIFRTDPWRLVSWLNDYPMAIFYHRAWFGLMILALLRVLWAPPSNDKSALLLTYFILWSIFGPIVHTLLPAAGPIFFARLGYGDAFAGLVSAEETARLSDYLWSIYSGARFGPGSGISAMPSLHIATTLWMCIAIFIFARRWTVPIALAATLISMLSVSLGWHYAIDGVVGGAGTMAIWCSMRTLLNMRSKQLRATASGAAICELS